jgi:hypothetical protein
MKKDCGHSPSNTETGPYKYENSTLLYLLGRLTA